MPCFSPDELAVWCGGQWRGTPPGTVTGVSNDTRTIRKGDLYVALAGERFDGHEFVPQAFERGAAAALVSGAGRSWEGDGPLLEVADTGRALMGLGGAYRGKVAPRVVGVTGSVGKTTVKEMTAAVLGAGWPTARTHGNWNNNIGLPLSLLRMEPGTGMGVFEIGMNHVGEISELSAVLRPDWGIVTAVGAAHIGHFASLDEIAREKAALLEALSPSGRAFLDARGGYFELLSSRSPAPVVTVALSGEADYVCAGHDDTVDRVSIRESRTGDESEFHLPSPGRHNIVNAMLAVAVGREAGMSWDAIQTGFESCRSLPLRWQPETIDGVLIVNDAYNANPVSMEASIDTFGRMRCEGRRWLVLGAMLELGSFEEELHRWLGREIAAGPWAGIVLVGTVSAAIGGGAVDAGYPADRVHCLASTAEAAVFLARSAKAGDAVFLKASRSARLEEIVELLGSTAEVE